MSHAVGLQEARAGNCSRGRGPKRRRPPSCFRNWTSPFPGGRPRNSGASARSSARTCPAARPTFFYDYLTDELREAFHIVNTANVSRHGYDEITQSIIARHKDGLVLDCGAGSRPVYHDNVVNFEICAYESTDVRGVGERLPFRDGVFDAVVSLNVLEHVRAPFACGGRSRGR